MNTIRNFAIISHIDHGKSTLADRLLELTGTIPPREMRDRVLDNMELEREKGITIKLKAVRMEYREFILNLIDTPGHVDFSYEVSRSLAACEGALLLVDATQGIQAQTLANVYKAQELNLKIIPIVNKIDLPNAEPEKTAQDLIETLGFKKEEVLFISAKTGEGVAKVLEEIVERIPPPSGKPEAPFRALVFDSSYDPHKGVLTYIRVVDGKVEKGTAIKFLGTETDTETLEIGVFTPEMRPVSSLSAGEVGYIATGLKDLSKVKVGDTVIRKLETGNLKLDIEPLPGYKEIKPVVFAGFFPIDSSKYLGLRKALEKLHLTDASFTFDPEANNALGNGFLCGFLGLLHLEIIRERLEREFHLEMLSTAPSVEYKIRSQNSEIRIQNASELPEKTVVKEILEPWVKTIVYTPQEYSSRILDLVKDKRGFLTDQEYLGGSLQRLKLACKLPLSEMVVDFYDRLKSVSSGFASLDWEFLEYRPVKAVRLDILVNKEIIPPLSSIVVKEKAAEKGQQLVKRLKEVIPRQQFAVPLQAAIGGKVLARETIPAMRKNVTAKLYGGDRTRKDKLLQKQKEGKKRLAKIGKIQIPQEAFRAVLEG